MGRITFDIDDPVHKEIKVRSVYKNCTMRDWIIQAIVEKIVREDMVSQDVNK